MIDHEAAPVMAAAPVTIQLRYHRLALMVITFAAALLLLMVPFAGDGLVIDSFLSTEKTKDQQNELRDDYNSKSSSIVSAFNTPTEWALGAIVPVCFLALASGHHVQTEQAFVVGAAFMGIEMGIKYLINNGFQAVNVQIVAEQLRPYIAASDMKANTDALDVMLSATTNVSQLVTEVGDNVMTNTVLRNVLAPIVLKTPPVCKRSDNSTADTSQFATGLVQSYGFPARSWQSTMLPSNLFVSEYTYQVLLGDNTTDFSAAVLPMTVSTASNLFIHGVHVSRFFFRWFDADSAPFNISGLVQNRQVPDAVSSNDSSVPVYTVPAAELLDLVLPASSDANEVEWFLGAARDLFRKSLATGVDIAPDDATMEFWHGDIDGGYNITFDAVTFEVPLRRNFYYRKLIFDEDSDVLVEDKEATAFYTNATNADSVGDIYYDLDMSADCGPNPGLCVMPRVQEYDYYGSEYQPDPQIKATAICLNANGTEDFQIFYDYYVVDGNVSNTIVDSAWACNNKSTTSMYIVSLGSRIEGDAMYDSPAPDATVTPLDGNRSTIVNPRKIYHLTVVRVGWELNDFAADFNATCLEGELGCRGLEYLMDVPVAGLFSNTSNASYNQFMLVGESSIPVDDLSPFMYNDTEIGGSYDGFGSATRWVSLMTLATPAEDAVYSQKGDVLLAYNFGNVSWSSGLLSSHNCSDSAEDFLNHIVNNHYYMDHGLQASYTSGMYFLFQNGIIREIVNMTEDGTLTSLAFDGNEQWMNVTVLIPVKSLIITFTGVGLIVLAAICAMVFSRCGQRSLLKQPKEFTIDMVADMMRNDAKYPPTLLDRRFDTVGVNGSFQKFRIECIQLRNEDTGATITLPLDVKMDQYNASTSAEHFSPKAGNPYIMQT